MISENIAAMISELIAAMISENIAMMIRIIQILANFARLNTAKTKWKRKRKECFSEHWRH
jgi:hypothetical protein